VEPPGSTAGLRRPHTTRSVRARPAGGLDVTVHFPITPNGAAPPGAAVETQAAGQ
jgi:hypothetical protein